MAGGSDSDSEDDAQMQQFLEAADPNLLTNAMFQHHKGDIGNAAPKSEAPVVPPPISQRYLLDDDVNDNARDLKFSEGVQTHIWKKLRQILNDQVEFCEKEVDVDMKQTKASKSKVRLLKGDDCFVKAYDEIVEERLGPQIKPDLKRRQIESTPLTKEILHALAVSGDDVLLGADMKSWAPRRERPSKLYHYAADKHGKLHSREPENEFTALRRKRNWHASMIKQPRQKNTSKIKRI